MLLSELLTLERVKIPLGSTTKDELLEELVDMVAAPSHTADAADILRAVREREAVLSTGIGHGVAIPHGKAPMLPTLRMAAGRTSTPVEFDALDGEPVEIFFLLVGPEAAAGPHIKALSRISRIVRREDVRDRLTSARSPEEFFAVLKEAEGA